MHRALGWIALGLGLVTLSAVAQEPFRGVLCILSAGPFTFGFLEILLAPARRG
jgi:hypothetical protein